MRICFTLFFFFLFFFCHKIVVYYLSWKCMVTSRTENENSFVLRWLHFHMFLIVFFLLVTCSDPHSSASHRSNLRAHVTQHSFQNEKHNPDFKVYDFPKRMPPPLPLFLLNHLNKVAATAANTVCFPRLCLVEWSHIHSLTTGSWERRRAAFIIF